MMSDPIGIDIDRYGTYARPEALADWLELAALVGRRMASAQLEDLISDNGWTHLKPRQFKVTDADAEWATPEVWTDATKAALNIRAETLGDLWPFKLVDSWRVEYTGGVPRDSPYVAMLALSVAHAWEAGAGREPEKVLESTAARALRALGLRVAQVGTAVGQQGGFEGVLTRAAQELGLASNVGAAPVPVSAKDEGVDTIALVGWPEDRRKAGQWLFLGQVTTARSVDWKKKIGEPIRDHWQRRLMQPFWPQRFLVVPHQVNAAQLTHLVSNDSGLVVDRLRLVLSLDDVSDDESALVDAVLKAGVDDGRAAA